MDSMAFFFDIAIYNIARQFNNIPPFSQKCDRNSFIDIYYIFNI